MFILLSLFSTPVYVPPSITEIVVEQNDNSALRVSENDPILRQQLHLISQQREGERRIFEIPLPEETIPEATPTPIEKIEVVEVIADRQEYDEQRQVITAEGNVVMRFSQAVLTGDRIQVNLADRIAVAEGNVVLKRGEQILGCYYQCQRTD